MLGAFHPLQANGMYLFAGNMLENSHVGILFIDFERQKMKTCSYVSGLL